MRAVDFGKGELIIANGCLGRGTGTNGPLPGGFRAKNPEFPWDNWRVRHVDIQLIL
ncbi:hypothetical protein GCM10008941_11400 [Rhizomicrobium palustre]